MVISHVPVQQQDRIESLDVLRGFALLGILIVNIQIFAMVEAAYQFPNAFGDLGGPNYWTWWITHVFFDLKMMTIFSALFGAGIVLMSDRATQKTGKVTGLHFRRMLWLLVFGLAHAYLIWYGDILVSYALCGMIVFWIRNLKPKWLILIGLMSIGIASVLFLLCGLAFQFAPPETIAEFREEWNPSGDAVNLELAAHRGSWPEQMPVRAANALMFQTFLFGLFTFWRVSGLMLIGMALYKLGIFSAKRSARFYVIGAAISLPIGLALVMTGVAKNFASGWDAIDTIFFTFQYNYWGSLLVSFGYVCLIMLLCQSAFAGWLKQSLAAVGQMALTNYLMHSIVCSIIFYGHGFGWFGYLDRIEQLNIVLVIWIAQMIVSPIWLARFRFGPFEWVWRSLVYWRRQPIQNSRISLSLPRTET